MWSGIKGVKSGIRRVGSEIITLGLGIQAMGSVSDVFSRDQAVPFLWDQAPKFVTLLESRIRNLDTKMGSTMKNILRYDPDTRGVLRKMSLPCRVFFDSREKQNEPSMGKGRGVDE